MPMKFLSNLRRHFLNAMPVIGPHADIEAELLLAGIKPVGFLFVFRDEEKEFLQDWRSKKLYRDVKILDQAVTQGKLKSMDMPLNGSGILRYYCQPGKERLMKIAADGNAGDEEAQKLSSWHKILGYRRRDELFFNFCQRLPMSVRDAIVEFNANAQVTHREELLKQCKIDPDQWDAQLKAEHILE